MFKITFIDANKKSKQIWNVEEPERTYVFGRCCSSFFQQKGLKDSKECYVDIFTDKDLSISKDQVYATLSSTNILEVKFKNHLKTFSADRECSRLEDEKYEYYYIKPKKSEKLKFKAAVTNFIVRVEYDPSLSKSGERNNKQASKNTESVGTRRNFSIESLANFSSKPDAPPNSGSKSQEKKLPVITESDSNDIIEAVESLKSEAENPSFDLKLVDEKIVVEDHPVKEKKPVELEQPKDLVDLQEKNKRVEAPTLKEKKKPGRKPTKAKVTTLAKKEQEKAKVNNLMHTLYEAQKKNQKVEKIVEDNDENVDQSESSSSTPIQIRKFTLKSEDDNKGFIAVESVAKTNVINYKRFKKRKLGDIVKEENTELPIKKLTMKKYIDSSIPIFKTMKDIKLDTRKVRNKAMEYTSNMSNLTGARKKTSETKHLFLDE